MITDYYDLPEAFKQYKYIEFSTTEPYYDLAECSLVHMLEKLNFPETFIVYVNKNIYFTAIKEVSFYLALNEITSPVKNYIKIISTENKSIWGVGCSEKLIFKEI